MLALLYLTRLSLDQGDNSSLALVECRDYVRCYAASWLGWKSLFLDTPYHNRETLEWASFNIFNTAKPRAWKLEEKQLFYVNHISIYEHRLVIKYKDFEDDRVYRQVVAMSEAEEVYACGARMQERYAERHKIVGLVPFFSGTPESSKGNSHARSPPQIKLRWLSATICSLVPWIGEVVVGVCSGEDLRRVHGELKRLNLTADVHVDLLECRKPVYLPYELLRAQQARLKAREQTKFVYYTEMDQPLRVRDVGIFGEVGKDI